MHFKAVYIALIATLFATSGIAAAVPDTQAAQIATNAGLLVQIYQTLPQKGTKRMCPDAACRCPNNCSHKLGSECKYKAGTSTDGTTIKGKCGNGSGGLTCVPK